MDIGANAEDMKECSLLACCPWLVLPAFFIAPRIFNTGVALPTVSCPSQPSIIINQEIAPQPCQKAHSKANKAGDIFSIKIPSSQMTWLCQIDIKLARISAKCFFSRYCEICREDLCLKTLVSHLTLPLANSCPTTCLSLDSLSTWQKSVCILLSFKALPHAAISLREQSPTHHEVRGKSGQISLMLAQ